MVQTKIQVSASVQLYRTAVYGRTYRYVLPVLSKFLQTTYTGS